MHLRRGVRMRPLANGSVGIAPAVRVVGVVALYDVDGGGAGRVGECGDGATIARVDTDANALPSREARIFGKEIAEGRGAPVHPVDPREAFGQQLASFKPGFGWFFGKVDVARGLRYRGG